MPRLRRVEQPRRDRRPASRARVRARVGGRGHGGADARRALADVGEPEPPAPRRSGSASSTGSSAAGSSRARSSSLGGEPGIGKSTLLLQAAAGVAAVGRPGAASCTRPARSRPPRSACAPRASGCSTAPAGAASAIARRVVDRPDRRRRARRAAPALLVVDSIQTATVDELDGPAGSVGQVREPPLRLMELAKGDGIAVVLVGHVTKDGSIAGPEDPRAPRRRGPRPSRASATRRSASCARRRTASARPRRSASSRWARRGLAEVADPARAFLAEHDGPAPGSVVAPTLEGSRPLLVEVQALVAPGARRDRRAGRPAASTRTASRCSSRSSAGGPGIGLASHDVYVNLAGGLSVDEPGLDLPLALALASSLRDRPIATGHGRDRRGRPARRAALGRRPRAPAARGRPARVRPGDRARGRRAAPPSRASPASRSSRSAASARRSRRRWRRPARSRGAWRRRSARC